MRFLFGLMAVAAVYLGWQWYADQPALNGGEMFEKADRTSQPVEASMPKVVDAGSGSPPAGPTAKPMGETAPKPGDVPTASPEDPLADVDLSDGFGRLRLVKGAEKERLSAALAALVSRTDNLDGMLAVLGKGNSFLHSEVGRKAGREAVARILKLNPESSVALMSALLEQCMRGSLKKTDTDAGAFIDEVYRKHKVLVDRVVFSPANLRKARSHPVRKGETLDGIARRYRKQGVNVEGWTLCYMNRISRPNRLRAGVTIKIPVEPIWAKIEKESFLMAVYVGETIVRLYWVAHGADDKTPIASFTVGAKLENPDWYAPDGNTYPFGHPKNVLGKYFVKFSHESYQGFGAHGTSEPESIRTKASLGCLRLYDADIREFSRFVPRGSKVVIASTQ